VEVGKNIRNVVGLRINTDSGLKFPLPGRVRFLPNL